MSSVGWDPNVYSSPVGGAPSASRASMDPEHFGVTQSPTRLHSRASLWEELTASSDAEATALSFLRSLTPATPQRMFSGIKRGLPDTRPLIPEGDGLPQDMLPLPVIPVTDLVTKEVGDWVDVDSAEDQRAAQALVGEVRCRGNEEWAPPRRQVIYHLHPRKLSKRKALANQNHRCAGCGLTVELNYVQRFRYCDYLGKYFCHSCHSNSNSLIPARVLWKWDFRQYAVSNFARGLLDDIRSDPLYDLTAVDQGALYTKVGALKKARVLRQKLRVFRQYLQVCRGGVALNEMCNAPAHLATEPDLYSLAELEGVKAGTYLPRLQSLVASCVEHVENCPLCMAKGHICEVCNSDTVIFSFQDDVTKCPECKAVFHKKCFVKGVGCPKCARIERYRLRARANSRATEGGAD